MLFLRVTSPSNFSYSLRITSLHFIFSTLLQSHISIILQRRGFSRILSVKWATKIQSLWRKILAKRSVSQRRIEVAAGGVLLRTLFYYQCRWEVEMMLWDILWSGVIWYDMIWYDMIWYDMIWYDITWYDMIWYDVVWYNMIWYDVVWYDMIWYLWSGVIWYDMMWYVMIWCDMIWYDMI